MWHTFSPILKATFSRSKGRSPQYTAQGWTHRAQDAPLDPGESTYVRDLNMTILCILDPVSANQVFPIATLLMDYGSH